MQPLKVLVIGIGNILRGDDGVGQYVCDDLAKLQIDHLEIVKLHQLQIEIIDTLIQYDKILIVDASISADKIAIEKINRTSTSPASSSHYTSVAMLYALAKQLYQKELNIYTCAIPVKNFEMGEGLSEFTRQKASEAVALITQWINKNA